jgi:hypothetical protein
MKKLKKSSGKLTKKSQGQKGESQLTKNKKDKWVKFVFFSDNHGDMEDTSVTDALVRFIDKFKPHHRIHGGDCFDIKALRKGAEGKEVNDSLEKDISMGCEFIRRVKPTVFLWGNHEDRLFKTMESSGSGIIRDYCKEIIDYIVSTLKEVGCKTIKPYHAEDGTYKIGPIVFCHGYTANQNSVKEHAIHYAPSGGACVIGHLHTIMQANARRHKGVVGFCSGWLGKQRTAGYAKARLNSSTWGNGWLYGWVKGNEWKILQAHKVGGKWMAPIDFELE